MLEGVLERRCHCAAFGHSACLLTKPLAEEERGCAEPRVSSKSRVTTLMAHPTQIYRIESWESGPSPSHEGLNRKRHFLSAMPRPSESRDPHWRRKGRWAPKNGPPSSLLSALRMLSKLHCLNDGRGASQTSGKLGCRAGSPSLIRLSIDASLRQHVFYPEDTEEGSVPASASAGLWERQQPGRRSVAEGCPLSQEDTARGRSRGRGAGGGGGPTKQTSPAFLDIALQCLTLRGRNGVWSCGVLAQQPHAGSNPTSTAR